MAKIVPFKKPFVALLLLFMLLPGLAFALDHAKVDKNSRAALKTLYASSPGAKSLAAKAKAVLVFPNIVKAGLLIGAQSGDGALYKSDKVNGYYNTTAVSIGLQAGAQSFGYALFFMSDKVLADFKSSENFEVGVGPNVVIIDAGAAKDISNLTTKADVYAIIFDQKGLMGGFALQGAKITRVGR